MTNPNTRRDKLAEEECSKHDPSLEHWDDREAFKAGFAAARAEVLVEIKKLADSCGYVSIEALIEYASLDTQSQKIKDSE